MRRSSLLARALVAAAAVAVAVALIAVERDRDGCERASRAAFLASQAPERVLQRRIGEIIAACPGSESLTQIAVGLRVERPRAAARLARAAVGREPESYAAWAVLAVAAPAEEARTAWLRARRLNPLAASGAGP